MNSLIKLLIGAFLALSTFNLISSRYFFNTEYFFDSEFGWGPRPGCTVISTIEGHGSAHYCAHKVRREKEWDTSGAAPIVVLGDSVTEAHQVSDREVYTDVIERYLRDQGIPNPVLNFAQSGNSVADYVNLASPILAVFKPAWVVIQVGEGDFTTDAWHSYKSRFSRFVWDSGQDSIKVVNPEDNATPSRSQLTRQSIQNAVPLVRFTLSRISKFRSKFKTRKPLFRAGNLPKESIEIKNKDIQEYPIKSELALLNSVFHGRITILYISSFDPRNPFRKSSTELAIETCAIECKTSFISTSNEYPFFAAHRIAPFGFGNTGYNKGHMNVHGHQAAANVSSREIVRLKSNGFF